MSAPFISFDQIITSVSDTETTLKTTFKECYDTVLQVLKHSTDASKDAMKLKAYMSELAETQKELSSLAHASAEIKSAFETSVLDKDSAAQLFDNIRLQHLQVADIDENQKEYLSSVLNFIGNSQAPEEEDSDLLVTKETQSYKDPLSQCIIENPVKSKLCNHFFENSSILNYLGNFRKKCPYSGCRSFLRKDDLIFDLQLKVFLSERQQDENYD